MRTDGQSSEKEPDLSVAIGWNGLEGVHGQVHSILQRRITACFQAAPQLSNVRLL